MKNSKALAATVITALILAISAMGISGSTANAAHVLPVGLGTAAPFAILAGTPKISNVPTSRIIGDVGLSPTTGAGIELTCPEVTGTIYSVDAAGPLPCRVTNLGLLAGAKNAVSAAIVDAAGRTGGLPVTQLAGQILQHGVYTNATAMDLALNGLLTLDGGGDPNAVFIFQLGTLLTVNNNTRVNLIGQAQACNVFWKVDSATIGTTASFVGTILAQTSITVASGSSIDGRLLAVTGDVTLDNNTITRSTCAAALAPPPPLPPCPPGLLPPLIGCIGTPAPAATATPGATVAATTTPSSATTTPTGATATPTGATATPTVASVATATPTMAPSAPTVAPAAGAVAGTQNLPSTSTGDPLGPLAMLGIALTSIGILLLARRPARHP